MEQTQLDVLFTPAEFEALSRQDLAGVTCVVLDILRATSSMITALANGATAITPVAEIDEALEMHRRNLTFILAGERNGLRIHNFHLGNSPREFTPDLVRDRSILMTTTNGTRALRAAQGADAVHVCSFLNLAITARQILDDRPRKLIIICSGTFEQAAYEDLLAAGALCELLWPMVYSTQVADSALIALKAYEAAKPDLRSALEQSRNGKRLLSRPELADDVAFCARRDATPIRAHLEKGGRVVRW